MPPRAVMDTKVLYAGLRSRSGASFQVLDALWRREWTLVLSNTVLTEYEEILKRESVTLSLTLERINKLLDALCSLADRRHLSESWLPVLTDVIQRGSVPVAQTKVHPAPVHAEPAAGAPAIPSQTVTDTLAEELLSELGPKLSEVMEKQVATELRKNMDETVAMLLSQLDVNVREIVRDAVAEKLKSPKSDT